MNAPSVPSRARPLLDIPQPSARHGRVRLGMPQLAPAGLSEAWLLKELGDRHWNLIAEAAGLERPDFRDRDGAPVYPAFCAVSIDGARFDLVAEHADLAIQSELARTSATQFASRHRLACSGEPIGIVTLSSVFVRRRQTGNTALARVAAPTRPMPLRPDFADLAAVASRMRAGTWDHHFGFAADAARPQGRVTHRPCPSQDFNGAGFLYFPSFAAFVDRAEWELLGVPDLVTAARDVFYYSNLDVGEVMTIDVLAVRNDSDELCHWCRIGSGDGRRLADVFTRRMKVSGGSEPALAMRHGG